MKTAEQKREFTPGQVELLERNLKGKLGELAKQRPDGDNVASDLADGLNEDFHDAFDFELGVTFEKADGRTVDNAHGDAWPILIFDGGAWPMPKQLADFLISGAGLDYDALRTYLNGLDRDQCLSARYNDALAYSGGQVHVYVSADFYRDEQRLRPGSPLTNYSR